MINRPKILKIFIFIVLFVLNCSESVGTDNQNKNGTDIPDPFAQNVLLNKTINLGNALEAPEEGDWGITLDESHFEVISAAGFTAVRVPIRWSAHTTENAPYTIDPFFMARVIWVLDQAEKNNLAAILDMHHFEEIFSNPAQEKAKLLAMWTQIAKRFVERPTTVFYEVLNEPHDNLDAQLWNVYLADAINTIRAVDSVHTIIIGTAEWGGISAMNKLVIPEDEKNVIFTFHYYEPFHFTHQGAEWVENSNSWLGEQWLGSDTEKLSILEDFSRIKIWAENRNLPVFLGEFGAYNKADIQSRMRWMDFICRTAESNNFSWAYWEFASGFGVYDALKNEWHQGMLKVLIP